MSEIDHDSVVMKTRPTSRSLGKRGTAQSEHIEITELIGSSTSYCRIYIGGGDVHWFDLDTRMMRELAARLIRKADRIEAEGWKRLEAKNQSRRSYLAQQGRWGGERFPPRAAA